MTTVKRLGSFLLALVMVLSLLPATHAHATETTSGTCGDPDTNSGKDVSWSFQDGVLTISGTGKTNEYGSMGEMYGVPFGHDHLLTPWNESDVTSFVVEEGITAILGLLSWGAYNLTEVSLPDSLKTIGHCSFEDCNSLTNITIPQNVTSIWSGAFWACENLTSITFTGDAPSINDYAFNSAVTATCYYPASANWPVDKLKNYGGNLTWVAYDTCADGHTFGTDDVCTGCGIIGGTCGSDLIWTLDDAGKLTITGTGGIKDYNVGASPFYKYRDTITSVELPDGLTSIGERAFDANFPNLEYIEIPTSVSLIRDCAFGATYDQVKLKYAGTMEQWNKITIVEFTSYGKQYGAECSDGTIIYKGPCGGSDGLYSTVQYALLGDGTLKITGSGAMKFYRYLNYESCFSSDKKIKKVEIAEGVTSIAGYAFKDCTNLTEVHIPASVTSISYNVFQGCTALTDVYYGSNEKNWKQMSISTDSNEPLATATIHYTDLCTGGHTWVDANCTTSKTCSVCDATEGEALGHSWNDANCTTPKTCSACGETEGEAIPDAHTWVDANCTAAQTCSLCGATQGEADPDAHSFVNGACEHCGLLGGTCGENAHWTLKDGLLTISGTGTMTSAPWPKTNITSVIIEEGITTICESAFEDCENLTSVTIPSTVVTLGSRCFYGCKSLLSVDLPEGITTIPYEAFAYCWALTSLEIPQSVTTIGGKAFYYSREIVGMQIPEKVTSIGTDAFTGCSKLEFVRFNGNAPTLGSYAFRSLTLKAFYPGYDTTWTADVRKPYGGTVTWVAYDQTHTQHSFDANGLCSCGCIGGTCGENATWALDPATGTLTISGTGKMDDYSYSGETPWAEYKDAVRKAVVEEGITHVGGCAFKEFSNLESVSLPDSLQSIGREAIMICPKLKEIEIPENVTSIGSYAFEQCYALESVVLPEGLTTINSGLFNACTNLKSVTIPASVTSIGISAFNGCSSLADVYYGSNEKAWNQVTIGSYNTALNNATIHYTDPCLQGHNEVCGVCSNCGIGLNLQDYLYTLDESAATVTLTDYIGSGTDVHVAAAYLLEGKQYQTLLEATSVFRGNTAITSVTIDDGVTTASNSMAEMFYGCASLKTADLAGLDTAGVTSLHRLFSGCKKLVSADVTGWDTSAVEDMSYLFDYCSVLTTVTGYENWNTASVWNLNKAFNRTTSIDKVDLSQWNLSQITNSGWCFQLCYAEEILLPDNLAVMSAGFFNHPSQFAGSTFTIPSGVKKIGYAHTIYDFGTDDFSEFIVPEDNGYYQAVDGILYSEDGTELIAIPRGKTFENGVFEIPNTVTFMGELSFSRNYNIETVVLPDNFIIEYVPLYDTRYILEDGHGGNDTGNLNSGTNLSIAIYCYTGITNYDVRDTNPHYEAVDGVIYSEDMTALVAVPARYAQKLTIPEGVTTWNKEALWADLAGNSNLLSLLDNCTGVSIPSTLTTIDAEQLSMINSLADRTSSAFTITVAEGNRTFHVDPATGHLAKHSYSAVVTDPTCEEQGYTTHTCATCGDSYKDSYTEAKSHSWVAADCDTPKTCSSCGETEGEALGHSWVAADCDTPKTWSSCGETEGEATGHAWIDATCYSLKTCNNCGITEGSMLEHDWQAADCTSPKHCSNCTATEGEALGHSWQDADCDTPKTCSVCGTTEGEALGHSWAAADCDTPKTCSACGETEGEATGHAWIDATCYSLKTCNNCGITEGSMLEHQWQAADCTSPKHCSNCTATEGEALGHSWVDANCTDSKTCGRCGATEGEALGHNWNPATCTEHASCKRCGQVSYGTKLNHTEVSDAAVEPTCTETGLTEGKHCSVCGAITVAQQVVPVKTHTWKSATCVAPKTCSSCGATQGSAKGHDWNPATCTENASCKRCGEVAYGTRLNHTEAINLAVKATCTTVGKTEGKYCTTCGTVTKAQQTIPALGHTEVTDPAVAATCTTIGKTEGSHCDVCNTVIAAQQTIPAKGHTTVPDAAVAATCTKPGKTAGSHCKVCAEVIMAQVEIPATGHSWLAGNCTTPKTCSACGTTTGGVVHAYEHQYDYKCDICGKERTVDMTRPMVDMFRMYNPNTGEHFYTGSTEERDNLISVGWQYEGVGFTFPLTTGKPVYRLFQPSTGEHLYTMDEAEKAKLMAEGWNYEGIAFNSGFENEVPQFRLHNPNATVGAYHFTASAEERDNLLAAGWEYQGIGWYSLGA